MRYDAVRTDFDVTVSPRVVKMSYSGAVMLPSHSQNINAFYILRDDITIMGRLKMRDGRICLRRVGKCETAWKMRNQNSGVDSIV